MNNNTSLTPAAQKILDTASRLFYWRGIHAVGVESIASEAGVTKKTLYDRFGSKDQLIVAYLKERDRKWKEHLIPYLDAVEQGQPIDKILAVFDALESWLHSQNQRGCAFINALAELDELHPGRAVIIEEKKWLKELFGDLLEKADHAEPAAAAEQLLMLHEGLMVTYSMKLFSSGVESVKETAAGIVRGRSNS
ncbi:transcriptional regulator, TetR family protein [Paenibacillus algicola]|uniref:Transcriptional regulator, TetR family protein n=1 Tax=Paenibacillus algicola TaxID=2565926 RepID=A0A4P8XHJ0_9BACL|nr:TetR/AcrR family transcriptional regulator [Paenibacillus algicola]QCT01825.1 transcriptional regulator, TetR family protein [Paenibacillus algicola]